MQVLKPILIQISSQLTNWTKLCLPTLSQWTKTATIASLSHLMFNHQSLLRITKSETNMARCRGSWFSSSRIRRTLGLPSLVVPLLTTSWLKWVIINNNRCHHSRAWKYSPTFNQTTIHRGEAQMNYWKSLCELDLKWVSWKRIELIKIGLMFNWKFSEK